MKDYNKCRFQRFSIAIYVIIFWNFLFFLLQEKSAYCAKWIGRSATTRWSFVCYDKNNDALLATTEIAIYRSTDGGINWDLATNPSGEYIIGMITTTKGIIANTSSGNMYITNNLGNSWTQLGVGVINNVYVFSANDSGGILVAKNNKLLFSSNSGKTWISVDGGQFLDKNIEDILVDNNGYFYVADYNFSIYRSLNVGSTWEKSPTTFSSTPCSLASTPDGTLYVGTYWDGIFKSEDHGFTWSSMSNGLPEHRGVAQITAFSNSILYLIVSDQFGTVGLYRFDSNIDGWVDACKGLTVNQKRLSCVSATNGTTVWLSQDLYGIGRSNNGGQSWTGFSSAIPQNVISMAPAADGVLYVGCNDTPYSVGPNSKAMGVLYSVDNGDTWSDLNEGLTEFDMAVQGLATTRNNTLIVLPYSPGQILSKKGLESGWERQSYGYSTFGSISKTNDGTLLVGNYWLPLLTSNNGYSWTELSNGWPENSGSGVAIQTTNGDLYASCSGQIAFKGLYRYSSSIGWSYIGFSGKNLSALLSTKSNKILAATSDAIYISYDNGAKWNTFSSGLPSGTGAYSFLESSDGTIYSATRGTIFGVYMYRKDGNKWENMGFPINSKVTSVYSLTIVNACLYAGTNNGVYYSVLDLKPIMGDVNRDSKVDVTDAILSLQVLSGMLPVNINPAGDVDGDGKIGMAEAIYVMQVVTGLR